MAIPDWLIRLLFGMQAVSFLGSGCAVVSHSPSDSLKGRQEPLGIYNRPRDK